MKVTAASEQEQAQVGELMTQVQQATGGNVKVAFADQGSHRITPQPGGSTAVSHPGNRDALRGQERLHLDAQKRWVVERTFGWQARFRRLSRDHERLPGTPTGLHWLAAVFLMLNNLF